MGASLVADAASSGLVAAVLTLELMPEPAAGRGSCGSFADPALPSLGGQPICSGPTDPTGSTVVSSVGCVASESCVVGCRAGCESSCSCPSRIWLAPGSSSWATCASCEEEALLVSIALIAFGRLLLGSVATVRGVTRDTLAARPPSREAMVASVDAAVESAVAVEARVVLYEVVVEGAREEEATVVYEVVVVEGAREVEALPSAVASGTTALTTPPFGGGGLGGSGGELGGGGGGGGLGGLGGGGGGE